jgi:hypothetical protein
VTRRPDRRRGLARLAIVTPALALFAACGDEASPDPQGAPSGIESEAQGKATPAPERRGGVSPPRIVAPRPEGNERPVVTSLRFEPPHPLPGGSVRAVAEASDPEGDPIELSYTWRLNDKLLRVSGDALPLRDVRRGDVVAVSVTAGDGRAVSAPVELSVPIPNRAPEVRAARLVPDDGVPPGGRLRVVAEVFDPDGDDVEVAYTWFVNGTTFSEDGAELQKPVRRGDWVAVRLVPSDGEDEGEPFEVPEVEIANAAPRIVSEPGATDPDGVFRYRVAAEDIDEDLPLRFRLEQGPEGMTVDEQTGLVEWSPAGEQSGRHAIEIVVQDSRGASGTQSFELVVGGEGPAGGAAAPKGG